jgi:hypothetical protein
MNKIKGGSNFAVFLLFFGLATLEAFRTANLIKIGFWVLIGLIFLLADNWKKA